MKEEPIEVYLGLGSNLGDRQDNLDRALALLSQRLRVDNVSPMYETEPVGNTDQPNFLNMVCRAYTSLAPTGLLALAKGIERKLGRMSAKSNTPRPRLKFTRHFRPTSS